jgi:hypothetical protein
VPEGASGCVVVKLEPSTEAAQHLQLADVILEVEGTPIAADESVQFRDDERVDYSHVISLKHVGDTLNLKILRQGEVRLSYMVLGCCSWLLCLLVPLLLVPGSRLCCVLTTAMLLKHIGDTLNHNIIRQGGM